MPQTRFELVVNGRNEVVGTAVLDGALIELGYGTAKVATAVNGAFVPASLRGETRLAPGDRLEVVSAREGG